MVLELRGLICYVHEIRRNLHEDIYSLRLAWIIMDEMAHLVQN